MSRLKNVRTIAMASNPASKSTGYHTVQVVSTNNRKDSTTTSPFHICRFEIIFSPLQEIPSLPTSFTEPTANLLKKVRRQHLGFFFDFRNITLRAAEQYGFHAPFVADAVIDAVQSVSGPRAEEVFEHLFDIVPRFLLDDPKDGRKTDVHDSRKRQG